MKAKPRPKRGKKKMVPVPTAQRKQKKGPFSPPADNLDRASP